MSSLFIDDGYTIRKHIAAIPGLHPDLDIEVRPALHQEKRKWQLYANAGEQRAKADLDLIEKHLVSLNGETILEVKPKLFKLRSCVIEYVLDLILSYLPADEFNDLKN